MWRCLFDSHALYWWLEKSPKLSKRAKSTIGGADANGGPCYVASATFWELHRKERLGKLAPQVSVRHWPDLLDGLEWIQVMFTTTAIWIETAALTWEHRDPVDRVIAAMARMLGVAVLTKDPVFHAPSSPVAAVW